MSSAFVVALLCTFSWISVSVSEFHTVEVQPGEEVILLCNNFTKTPAFITWFKMDSRPSATCIASLWNYDANVSLYVGFPKEEFNMTSNMTTIFLHIKHVNFSDSGLHFCGSTWENKTEIVSATYLKVQEKKSVEAKPLMFFVLGVLVIFLTVVIIALVIRDRKSHAALKKKKQTPQETENLGSDDLNYAAPNFKQKAKMSRKPPSDADQELNVVYAGIR
uniref:Ig-like domain-containing protein n=1 Tax=Echeneis naucrates TaxID=173247 RepID=A0A665VK17_ECHNA